MNYKGGWAYKPDSVQHGFHVPTGCIGARHHAATIIPLGHGSHRASSGLPEG